MVSAAYCYRTDKVLTGPTAKYSHEMSFLNKVPRRRHIVQYNSRAVLFITTIMTSQVVTGSNWLRPTKELRFCHFNVQSLSPKGSQSIWGRAVST